jgi:hypothetical protein
LQEHSEADNEHEHAHGEQRKGDPCLPDLLVGELSLAEAKARTWDEGQKREHNTDAEARRDNDAQEPRHLLEALLKVHE